MNNEYWCCSKSKTKWKKGDEIICIENAGQTNNLTNGKTYIVIRQIKDYGSDCVEIIADNYKINVFCSRFTTLKQIRKEKLEKLK